MRYVVQNLVFFLAVIGCVACAQMDGTESDKHLDQQEAEEVAALNERGEKADSVKQVHVKLMNTEGVEVGKAVLTQLDEGVEIELEAWDLPPGVHGYHIHEKGICEPPTFESAGAHFNPTEAKHGFDHPEGPHAGDLPNIEVNEEGRVHDKYVNLLVTLHPDEAHSLLRDGGTSLMIHAKPDDYKSQPAGDAGERIACGVISQ